jgi:hypothetical protein
LLLCVALAAARIAVAQNAGSVDSCIRRLDPQVDIGYERIAARCPDLMRQLEQGTGSMWLPRGWNEPGNSLSAASLKELRELARRELRTTSSGATPDLKRLEPILAQLGTTDSDASSPWKRFKAWLQSIARSQAQSERHSGGWIARMIAQAGLSQAIVDLIACAALILVVVVAGAIVLNELRLAGLLRALFFWTPKPRISRAGPGRSSPHWLEIEQAALHERPALLLELISRQLAERGYLPPSGALTVRELLREAKLSDADRACLSDLALVAEQVRYSQHGVGADGLEAPLSGARELLKRLVGGPAPAAGAPA